MIIRPAEREDAPGMVEVIRGGFTDELLRLTVYGCHGIADYLSLQLALPRHVASNVFVVAEEDGRIVGSAEVARTGDTIVASYLAIREDQRGRGLGRVLLHGALEAARRSENDVFLLDVIETNRRAADWYKRLGFETITPNGWWVIDVPEGSPEGGVILGFPQAEAAHRMFGFSELRVSTARGEAIVGRLGDHFLRITDPAVLHDPEVWGIVRAVAPGRRLLVLGPDPGAVEGVPIFRLLRMWAPSEMVMSRFERSLGDARPSP